MKVRPADLVKPVTNMALHLRADLDKRIALRDGQPLKVDGIAIDRQTGKAAYLPFNNVITQIEAVYGTGEGYGGDAEDMDEEE